MKRKITILILILLSQLCISFGYGQSLLPPQNEDPYDPQLPNVLYPSPHAMQYMRYGQIPVSYSTGVPEISIPIYTLKANGLEIPINISYHASGVKVKDIAGSVGLGWVLNAGGMIAQTVYSWADENDNGPHDLRTIPFTSAEQASQMINADYNTFGVIKPFLGRVGYLNREWYGYLSGYIAADGPMPFYPTSYNTISDRFSFNFNGVSGAFRYNISTQQYETLPHTSLKISPTITNNGFVITDEKGIQWTFTHLTESSILGLVNNPVTAKEYYLTSIKFPGVSDVVSLTYTLGVQYDVKNYTESVFTGQTASFEYSQSLYGGGVLMLTNTLYHTETNKRNLSFQTIRSKPAYIQTIQWKDITITFNYTSDRSGLVKERLNNVSVTSGTTNITATLTQAAGSGDRMLLNAITVNGEQHAFQYKPAPSPSSLDPETNGFLFSEDF